MKIFEIKLKVGLMREDYIMRKEKGVSGIILEQVKRF
jgi:hypothetical protein